VPLRDGQLIPKSQSQVSMVCISWDWQDIARGRRGTARNNGPLYKDYRHAPSGSRGRRIRNDATADSRYTGLDD
jgi:hypothetical protein